MQISRSLTQRLIWDHPEIGVIETIITSKLEQPSSKKQRNYTSWSINLALVNHLAALIVAVNTFWGESTTEIACYWWSDDSIIFDSVIHQYVFNYSFSFALDAEHCQRLFYIFEYSQQSTSKCCMNIKDRIDRETRSKNLNHNCFW